MKNVLSMHAVLLALVALMPAVPAAAHGNDPNHKHAAETKPTQASSGGHAASAMTTKVTPKTMKGEIVDPQCWIQHDGRGTAHAGCALACAKAGQTLAFLDDKTGILYQLLAESHSADPNEKWYGLVGKPVIVKGDVMARGGMNAIVLRSAVVDKATKPRP